MNAQNSKYQTIYNDTLRRYNITLRQSRSWTPNMAWRVNLEAQLQELERLLAKWEIKMAVEGMK